MGVSPENLGGAWEDLAPWAGVLSSFDDVFFFFRVKFS